MKRPVNEKRKWAGEAGLALKVNGGKGDVFPQILVPF